MYKQKSRDKNLNLGDCNTKYFYALCKSNMKKSTIRSIQNAKGEVVSEQSLIAETFVKHFQNILAPNEFLEVVDGDIFQLNTTGCLTQEDANYLCRLVTLSEIKEAITDSSAHKAPGPDGFNTQFFKICWPIIGNDISAAIPDFFEHGRLLK